MRLLRCLLLSVLALLAGCSNKSADYPPVPLGKTEALQKLADAYTSLAETHQFSPSAMAPKAKKQFVMQVFDKAHFSYIKTLRMLAQDPAFDPQVDNQRELAKLVLFAHHGHYNVDPATVYQDDELPLVRQLEKRLQ